MKLYIPSTLNIDCLLWHTLLIVSVVNIITLYPVPTCHYVITCYTILDVQANLPETSTFLSAQMALVSTFFQTFIVLGIYNFDAGKEKDLQKTGSYKWEPVQIAKLIRHENIQQKNKTEILSALEHEPILSLYREIRHI